MYCSKHLTALAAGGLWGFSRESETLRAIGRGWCLSFIILDIDTIKVRNMIVMQPWYNFCALWRQWLKNWHCVIVYHLHRETHWPLPSDYWHHVWIPSEITWAPTRAGVSLYPLSVCPVNVSQFNLHWNCSVEVYAGEFEGDWCVPCVCF